MVPQQAEKMEILAPAGNWDMLRAAVYSGADCVYLGVSGFNARRGAANFEGEDLARAVGFCHARNCKVYAALNTLVFSGEEEALCDAVLAVVRAGCDAVIVQDLASAAVVKATEPSLALHGSTQMSVHTLAGVQMLAGLGFSRVILARELSEDEIAHIAAHSPIELEVFVQGALCVSVSGQCIMSAFLGGRSANRGACAGPCRLPFELCGRDDTGGRAAGGHALSLKDLSILKALPRLSQMGVVSAKIEGRLRGPEYCAVAVDSARKALRGEAYDEGLLQDVFSRSGFTDGWFTGENGGDMFGARTGEDSAAGRVAQPKARELYRREMPRVPVDFSLTLSLQGGELQVQDGVHTLSCTIPGPLPSAQKPVGEALQTALGKTGGTPFYAQKTRVRDGGVFLAASAVNALRKELLEELLQLREAPPAEKRGPQGSLIGMVFYAGPAQQQRAEAARKARVQNGKPLLRARFEHVAQLPAEAPQMCTELILPLFEADKVPEELRAKTRLWLPRVLFGPMEERAAKAVQAAKDKGFLGFEAQNIAHLWLCKELPVSGGFGLNVANTMAAGQYAELDCQSITLSPELTLAQLRRITEDAALSHILVADMLCYGHLPLMLTRACPAKQQGDCAACQKDAALLDRKGEVFPLSCRDGARQVYNPVPLWMGDRLADLPTHTATLYFTNETQKEARQVLQAFVAGETAPGRFTRGLYDRGVSV